MQWLVVMGLVLLAGCSRGAPTPQATQTFPPPPFGVTYCDINPVNICLQSFGLDSDERLMVTFLAEDPYYANIYIHAAGPEGEILFECQQSEGFPENIYCRGEHFPDGNLIKLNIYSKSSDKLIAIGVFTVQTIGLIEPDVPFSTEVVPTPTPTRVPTRTPSPSPQPGYPNPSYPNPSYPNPTFTSTPTPTSTPTSSP